MKRGLLRGRGVGRRQEHVVNSTVRALLTNSSILDGTRNDTCDFIEGRCAETQCVGDNGLAKAALIRMILRPVASTSLPEVVSLNVSPLSPAATRRNAEFKRVARSCQSG